jgi:hypothetical protein
MQTIDIAKFVLSFIVQIHVAQSTSSHIADMSIKRIERITIITGFIIIVDLCATLKSKLL